MRAISLSLVVNDAIASRLQKEMTAAYHHDHSHRTKSRSANQRRLTATLVLVLFYMAAEVIGGLLSGSLALLADAGHMLSDAGSLALALFAMWLASRPSGSQHTYGYYRTEILAALVNGATLVAISILIFTEAYQRLMNPPEVHAGIMMVVASGGLVVNLVGLWLLQEGRGESLNMQGVWLHILADTLGSCQAIAAGALIWAFGWHWADPVASIIIGVLIIFSSWSVLKESVAVLMESSPLHIDVDEVLEAMREVEGAAGVHDLHIWTITSGMVALSAHVLPESECDRDDLLKNLSNTLKQRFTISHVTIQIESPAHDCEPCF